MTIRHLAWLALIVVTGCGGEAGPRTVAVRGIVTYNGKPLTKGEVVFAPVDPTKSKGATAAIGTDGRFTPSTNRSGDGLMVGDYRITVTSYVVDTLNTPPPELAKLKDGGLAIPKRYTIAEQSGLTATISSADSGKELRLELQD
jgi:hypothetical protein